MQAINIKAQGIKCDNPNCNFRDENARFEEYEAWLNKPCPKCGANLLTEADLKTIKAMVLVANLINSLVRPFVKIDKNTPRITIAGEMDGSGRVSFKCKE